MGRDAPDDSAVVAADAGLATVIDAIGGGWLAEPNRALKTTPERRRRQGGLLI